MLAHVDLLLQREKTSFIIDSKTSPFSQLFRKTTVHFSVIFGCVRKTAVDHLARELESARLRVSGILQ